MLPDAARQRIAALETSDDPLDQEVAQRLNGQATRGKTTPAEHRPSRWRHVPLGELFAAHGNTLDDHGETIKTGHEPVHGSKSGTCVVLWPADGRWWCSSCRQSGDAATFVMAVEGIDYRRAETKLIEQFGRPAESLPEIVAKARQLRDVTRDALAALVASNDPPRIFVRERDLVRLVPAAASAGGLIIEPLADPQVRNELTLTADFVTIRKDRKTDEEIRVAVPPPPEVVTDCLAQSSWEFPTLHGVVDRPTLRRDGTLLIAPGYDRTSGLYLEPATGLRVPEILASPSAADVARAVALLDRILADFPLVSAADRAAALALGLLPFVREMVDGPTPLHMIEAPTPGSGKGLLADVLLYPSCGHQRGMQSQARDDDEWRKRLLAILREGRPAIQLDNINRTLDSGALCSVLTAYPTWSDRLLGVNQTLVVPVRCTWLATANNATLSMEMVRRTIRCRLDPQVDRPWEREGFGIPRLLEWVTERRGHLIWAYLTLARSWVAAGKPKFTGKALGTFERWSDVVGGILQHVGVGGFLGNLSEFYETADTETSVWRSFVLAWWDAHQDQEVGAADLFSIAEEAEGLDLGNGQERSQKIKFGKLLARQRDRVIADYRVAQVGTKDRLARWRLLPTTGRPKPTPVRPLSGHDDPGRMYVPDVDVCFDPSPAGADIRTRAYGDSPGPETYMDIQNIHPDVIMVADNAQLAAILPRLQAADVLGLDIETALAAGTVFDLKKNRTALDPRAGRVRLVQLAVPDGPVYVVDAFQADSSLLAPLFASAEGPVLVGHNLKFDIQMLAEAGLPIPNGPRLFDTMIAAHLLEDGAGHVPKGHFGLAGVAERYIGETLDKTQQTADWSGPLSDEQLQYAALDAAVLPKIAAVMREQLREADLERVAQLEMRTLPAVVWLERTGAPFDVEAWTVLAEQAARRQVELEQHLAESAGTLDMFDKSTVNWSSSQQVAKVLQARGHDVTTVDEDTLAALTETEPLAQLLLDYREQAKRVGTYGLGALKHVSDATGRMHADWKQMGSRAGRMSCSGPNLQQIPRAPAYRGCIRPPDGRVLVKADYSQIELRIVAEIANEARLLEAYAAGEDVHTLTAGAVLGRRNGEVTKEARQAAKAINFGLMYGCGVPTLRKTAKREYGVELSEAEAMQFRTRFFTTYPGLRAWHRKHVGEARPIDTRTLAGRRRLDVTHFTEQINTPIQGTGADGLKAALALLWETRDRCPSAAPVLVVHDEIVLECDQADVERAQAWLVDCMVRGMASFLERVPVVVEATAERDWSGTPLEGASE